MADVWSFPAGRSFTFTIYKHLSAEPSRKWVNSYEAVSISSGALVDLVTLGRALKNFEEACHPASVYFEKWEVRTGARDGRPYNPNTFYEEPIGDFGQNGVTMTNPVDLNLCVWLNRSVVTGRAGKVFFRGCLQETDIEAPGGSWSFDVGSYNEWETRIATANGDWLTSYLSGGDSMILKLVIIGPNGEFPRPILSFSLNGVTLVKKLRAFFNRVNAPVHPAYAAIDVEDLQALEGAATAAGLTFVPLE